MKLNEKKLENEETPFEDEVWIESFEYFIDLLDENNSSYDFKKIARNFKEYNEMNFESGLVYKLLVSNYVEESFGIVVGFSELDNFKFNSLKTDIQVKIIKELDVTHDDMSHKFLVSDGTDVVSYVIWDGCNDKDVEVGKYYNINAVKIKEFNKMYSVSSTFNTTHEEITEEEATFSNKDVTQSLGNTPNTEYENVIIPELLDVTEFEEGEGKYEPTKFVLPSNNSKISKVRTVGVLTEILEINDSFLIGKVAGISGGTIDVLAGKYNEEAKEFFKDYLDKKLPCYIELEGKLKESTNEEYPEPSFNPKNIRKVESDSELLRDLIDELYFDSKERDTDCKYEDEHLTLKNKFIEQ